MMPGVNYVIHGCSSARTTPGVSLYRNLTLKENIVAVITQDRVKDNSSVFFSAQTSYTLDKKSLPKWNFQTLEWLDENWKNSSCRISNQVS